MNREARIIPPWAWSNHQIAANGIRVRSNFMSWFEGSKVVTQARDPMLMYHGTNVKFDAFRPGTIYITNSLPYAQEMGASMAEDSGGSLILLPLYARIRNPVILEIEHVAALKDWPEEVERLKALGHDGAMNEDMVETVAFSPSQVKSAVNSGLFLRDSTSLTDHDAALDLIQRRQAAEQLREIVAGSAISPSTRTSRPAGA